MKLTSTNNNKIQYDVLYDLYVNQRKSTKNIAEILNVGSTTVKRYLKKFNIKSRTNAEIRISKNSLDKLQDYDWLCNEYIIQQKSTYTIANDLNVSQPTISKSLKIHNIQIRTYSECTISKDSLDKLNNYEWMYDRYVNKKQSTNFMSSLLLIDQSTVVRYLKKHNIRIKSTSEHKLTKCALEKLNDKTWLYDVYHVQMKTANNIAKILHIGSNTVLRYLKKHNISMISTSERFMSDDIINKLNDKDWLIAQHHINKSTLSTIAEGLNVTVKTVSNYCQKHNIEVKSFYQSTGEREVCDFIRSIYYREIRTNVRNIINGELDVYIPEKRLAIEYNGLYWHSELNNKNKYYHLEKTKQCEAIGIKLIHLWDIEWLDKQEIVKSYISKLLDIKIHIIQASNTNAKELTLCDSKKFLNSNHIQEWCSSEINFGLFFKNKIVSVLTVKRTRKNKYILTRYCDDKNLIVVDALKKLFEYFVQLYQPVEVIAYDDVRWNINTYNSIGFMFVKNTEPMSYHFHIRDKKLLSCIKSEENINIYSKIWDCGNSVWYWEKNYHVIK